MADDPTEGLTPEQIARKERAIELAQQEYEQAQLRREELEREGATRRQLAEAKAEEAKAEENLARAFGASGEQLRLYIRDTEKATEAAKRRAEQEAELIQQNKAFDNALKTNIKTLTGITDASDSLVASFFNQANAGQRALKVLQETITAQNVGISIARKFAEGTISLMKATDEATAGFAKATGLGNSFNSQIRELEESNRQFGVTIEESAQSFATLIDGLSGFALMGEDVQNALVTEVAQLQELGVSGADATGVIQSLTRTFGMNAQQSIALTQETETLAQELGISLGEAVNNLNSALPQLASLAADQVGPAFEALQKRAVETGLAVNDLIGIAGRFDTFDEAASAAGNLNAVLGTQMFDTMGLLEAQLEGPDAVIEQLRQGLLGSVSSFEDLTVFQRQAIANASGLNEQEIRGLFLSEEVTEEQKRQAEEREKNLKFAMTLKDELLALARELSVALQPLMDLAKSLISGFASITKAVKNIPLVGDQIAPAVTIGAGALAGGLVNKVLKSVGLKKGEAPTTSDGIPLVHVDNLEEDSGGDGDDGGGGFMDKMGGFLKDKFGETKIGQKLAGFKTKLQDMGKLGRFAKFGGKLGARFVPGLGQALLAKDVFSFAKKAFFQDGGGIAGTGPVPITAHGGEVVVPVQKTPAASNLANMVAEKSMNNSAMNNLVKEIRNLNNRPIQVNSTIEMDNREFGRSVNKHFGAAGSKPANSAV